MPQNHQPGGRADKSDPLLLTPGPLTTSLSVKEAMLHDFGSRDTGFIELNRRMLQRLVDIIHGQDSHVAVPLQGSGTFVVEAMIGNFVPPDGKVLICINGAYGQRIAKIARYYGRDSVLLENQENEPTDTNELERLLRNDTDITHVAVVFTETTSGIINPLDKIADIVATAGKGLLIDAMSCFGALPIDARVLKFDAVCASSNKCLEGAPGMGFCLARKAALLETEGNSPSLSLDLYDQWQSMEKNHQWRFTPPTHVILAFSQALNEFEAEGGVVGRGDRYRNNCRLLIDGMRKMGFSPLLSDELQAPIIVTFRMPEDSQFDFEKFYDALRDRGYVIYPGKLTVADSFRVGCIGHVFENDIRLALDAIHDVLREMEVSLPVT
ncbi:MAG: 2-aminoethylphosphonate--pyruvate transaminase [Pseudomonadota bacterium]